MKAVIYARYSSDNQREESIEGQIRECTAFAEKNGITILRHYIDRAFSAKTDNRPEFQNMIKDSGKRLFADEAPHDRRVHHRIHLLEQDPDDDGQGKNQKRMKRFFAH